MLPRYIFTAEIVLTVDAVGTVETRHYATEGFASRTTDAPPSTWFEPRLSDAGTLKRELFSGARVSGAVRPGFGRLVLSNADGALDAWLGYGVSGNRVVVRYGPLGGAYPADFTTVYTAYADTLDVDFDEVRILLRDRTHLLDRQIVTTRFAGTGGEEGTSIAVGLKRQMVIGKPGYIPLQLIDEDRRIYHVQSTPTDIDALNGSERPVGYLFEGGIERVHTGYVTTFDALSAAGLAVNQAKLLADFPHWPAELSGVYVRIAADAQYDLRYGAIGHALDEATETVRPWTFIDLVNRAGLTDVNPATLATPPGSINPTAGNRLISGDESYLDAMNDRAKSLFCAFGFDRLDRFWCLALHDPSEEVDAGDTIKFEFNQHNGANWRRMPVPGMESPVWQVAVDSGGTWPCSMAPTATTQNREYFTRAPWLTQFTGTSDSARLANPGAKPATVQITGNEFQTHEDQLAFIQRFIRLYGTRRDYITFTCHQFDAATLALDLHDRVTVRMPRMQCTTGRTFRIVTIALNLRARTIDFGLWGGDIGPDDAVLGGGDLYLPGPTPGLPVSTLAKFGRMAPFDLAMRGSFTGPTVTIGWLQPFDHLMRGGFTAPATGSLSVHLKFNGTHGSTTIVDSSSHAATITIDDSGGAGSLTLTTTAGEFQSGTAGATALDAACWVGSLTDMGNHLRLGTGAFGMGGWFNVDGAPGFPLFFILGDSSEAGALTVGLEAIGGGYKFVYQVGSAFTRQVGATTVAASSGWHYFFLGRDAAGVCYGGLDGAVSVLSGPGHPELPAINLGVAAGATSYVYAAYSFSGGAALFDDLWIVKGDPVHTAAFTPPAGEFSYP